MLTCAFPLSADTVDQVKVKRDTLALLHKTGLKNKLVLLEHAHHRGKSSKRPVTVFVAAAAAGEAKGLT